MSYMYTRENYMCRHRKNGQCIEISLTWNQGEWKSHCFFHFYIMNHTQWLIYIMLGCIDLFICVCLCELDENKHTEKEWEWEREKDRNVFCFAFLVWAENSANWKCMRSLDYSTRCVYWCLNRYVVWCVYKHQYKWVEKLCACVFTVMAIRLAIFSSLYRVSVFIFTLHSSIQFTVKQRKECVLLQPKKFEL